MEINHICYDTKKHENGEGKLKCRVRMCAREQVEHTETQGTSVRSIWQSAVSEFRMIVANIFQLL